MSITESQHRSNKPGLLYIVQTPHCIQHHPNIFKAGRTKNMAKRLSAYPKGTQLIARVQVTRMKDAEDMMMAVCRNRFVDRRDFGKEYFEGDGWDLLEALASVGRFFAPPPAGSRVVYSCEVEGGESEDEESEDEREGEERDGEEKLEGEGEEKQESEEEREGDTSSDPGVKDSESGEEDCDESNSVSEGALKDTLYDVIQHGAPKIKAIKPSSHLARDPSILLIQYINSNLADLAGYVDTVNLLGNITTMFQQAGCFATPSLQKLQQDLKRHFKCSFVAQHVFDDGPPRHATCFKTAITVALAYTTKIADNVNTEEKVDKISDTELIAKWLNENVEITSDSNHRIVLGELKQVYFESCKIRNVPAIINFPSLSKEFFIGKSLGVSFKRNDRINGNTASNVVRGVRLIKAPLQLKPVDGFGEMI